VGLGVGPGCRARGARCFSVRLGVGPGAGCLGVGSLPCVASRTHDKDFSLSCIFAKTFFAVPF
jgi:hypothetical protein